MRITEAEQEIRRRRMLHAAYELFCAEGIDSVSLAKIAKAADVSLNSIFRYFATKTELLEQTQIILWTEIVDCITEGNRQKRSESPNGLEEVRVLLYGFENLFKNHSQYIFFAYEYKAYLMRKHLKLPQSSYDIALKPLRDIFLPAIVRGQADGSIVTQQSAGDLFFIVWGVMRHWVEQMLVHDKVYDGQSPWEGLFPIVVEKIVDNLRIPF